MYELIWSATNISGDRFSYYYDFISNNFKVSNDYVLPLVVCDNMPDVRRFRAKLTMTAGLLYSGTHEVYGVEFNRCGDVITYIGSLSKKGRAFSDSSCCLILYAAMGHSSVANLPDCFMMRRCRDESCLLATVHCPYVIPYLMSINEEFKQSVLEHLGVVIVCDSCYKSVKALEGVRNTVGYMCF